MGPDGGRIPNKGQCDLSGATDECNPLDMTVQVAAELRKPRLAVRKLNASGHDVVFREDGQGDSYIIANGTGRNKKTAVYQVEDMFSISLWFQVPVLSVAPVRQHTEVSDAF